MENDEIKFRWLLERQLGWIASADSKLAITGTLPLAMLGLTFIDASMIGVRSSTIIPFCLVCLFLAISLWFTANGLFPRLSGPKDSKIFFGKIAKLSEEDYISGTIGEDSESHLLDLRKQVHVNACIANQKNICVRRALYALVLSMPLWVLDLFLRSGLVAY